MWESDSATGYNMQIAGKQFSEYSYNLEHVWSFVWDALNSVWIVNSVSWRVWLSKVCLLSATNVSCWWIHRHLPAFFRCSQLVKEKAGPTKRNFCMWICRRNINQYGVIRQDYAGYWQRETYISCNSWCGLGLKTRVKGWGGTMFRCNKQWKCWKAHQS